MLIHNVKPVAYFFSNGAEKKTVRKNMHWLVQNIEPMDHLDYLFSFEALNREEYELVRKQLTAAEKVSIHSISILNKFKIVNQNICCSVYKLRIN